MMVYKKQIKYFSLDLNQLKTHQTLISLIRKKGKYMEVEEKVKFLPIQQRAI